MRKSFIERSYKYEIDLNNTININCPLTILHGLPDDRVNYTVSNLTKYKVIHVFCQVSLKLMNQVKTEDVEVLLSKSADHQYSHPRGLELLSSAVLKMVKSISAVNKLNGLTVPNPPVNGKVH